jgi:probable F420-dependent oxidoreductase
VRFGLTHLPSTSGRELAAAAQHAERLGFDFLAAPDHLGAAAPFAALVAAGMVTERVRLRTYVLNVCFWNPALLAREASTADALTGGRLELGLGAGHMRSEFDDAGIAWRPLDERVERLESTVLEVRRRLADGVGPGPVQRPLPLAVGAMSTRGLGMAAEHADIVSFAGLLQIPGGPPGALTVATGDETDALVDHVRRIRGERAYEVDMLLQVVRVGVDPQQAAAELAERAPGLDSRRVLDSPFVLLARDARAGAAELQRRSERWGLASVTAFWSSIEALREVRDAMTPAYRSRDVSGPTR